MPMFVGIGFGTLLIAGLAQHFATSAVEAEVGRVEALEVDVSTAEQEVLEELERMLERTRGARRRE